MKDHSRRRFIKQTLLGTAGIAALPVLAKCTSGANDTIRIGIIGLGQQSMYLMSGFSRIPGVQIVAGADVYGIKRERLEKRLKDYYQENNVSVDVKTYKDYRELLDRQDIDAVVITTPDHWHALNTIDACKAGKDIYLEKPITFTLKESLAVVKAVREHDVMLAVGSQQRSDYKFRRACELVRNGRIGN